MNNQNNKQAFKISVITVVRNGEEILENTILNIINQKNCEVEFIVIDGGSSDNTVNIIKKYSDQIHYWESENDKGIYDAMNKGIKAATGEWINFMNAGDEFFNLETCAQVENAIELQDFDVIYGDFLAVQKDSRSEILIKARPIHKILGGMVFCHQSVFVKRQLLLAHPFSLDYKIVADYHQMLSLYLNKFRFKYIPLTISKIEIGGVSYSNKRTILETIKIIHSFKPYSLRIVNKVPQLIICSIRSLLGDNITSSIRAVKWKLKSTLKK